MTGPVAGASLDQLTGVLDVQPLASSPGVWAGDAPMAAGPWWTAASCWPSP